MIDLEYKNLQIIVNARAFLFKLKRELSSLEGCFHSDSEKMLKFINKDNRDIENLNYFIEDRLGERSFNIKKIFEDELLYEQEKNFLDEKISEYLIESSCILKNIKDYYRQIINEKTKSNNNYVFHALKKENATSSLSEGKIQGYTSQRVWPDGNRRKENDDGYEDSYFIKGLSTTRELDFALRWGQLFLF